ncbi:MAG: hypothetical protein U0R44_01245 [Candidatus Micrarchaeia archaeon]
MSQKLSRERPEPKGSSFPIIEVPKWEGKLEFRRAKAEESAELKALYDSSWGPENAISREQIEAKIRNFPEGQIVGCENGVPKSMINIMLTGFTPDQGFTGGYDKVTGNRTFSTHASTDSLFAGMLADEEMLPVALCVSIAVSKEHARNGFAHETLNFAIGFAENNGLIAAPYSAPRGFGTARAMNPQLDIHTYLHMTVPSALDYEAHLDRIDRMNRLARVRAAFRTKRSPEGAIKAPISPIFYHYREMGEDRLDMAVAETAFGRFASTDGLIIADILGRTPTVEDFCVFSGRKMMDPVMRMHVENGARFIRGPDGSLAAVFADSRPEDTAAAGYNVVLTYAYRKGFGHPFSDY